MAKLIIDIPQYVLAIAKTEKTIADADIDMVANAIAKGKEVPPEGLYTFENLVHLRDNIFDSINARFCEITARIEE